MRFLGLVALAGCGASAGAMKQATMGTSPSRQPASPIAIGARFYPEIATTLAGTTTPNLRLESALPDVVAVEDGALVGKRPGASAVLLTTDDGSVVDFIHVWVAPVTKISLARRDGERIAGPIGLAVGEDITLVPALWSGAQRLAGEGEGNIKWTLSDDRVVSVLHDGAPDRRRLRARAPGTATITLALGQATTTLELEVVP